MRIICSIVCVLVLMTNLQAQQTFVGLRVGATYTEMESLYGIEKTGIGQYDTLNTYYTKDRQGLAAGFTARFSLDNKVYFQPEILFAVTENEVAIDDPGNDTDPDHTQADNLLQLRVPVNAGLKLGIGKEKKLGIRGQAGIEAVVPITNTGAGGTYTVEEAFNNTFFNYQVGAGIDLGRIIIDLYMQRRLVGSEWMPFDNRGTEVRAYYKSLGYSLRLGYTFKGK